MNIMDAEKDFKFKTHTCKIDVLGIEKEKIKIKARRLARHNEKKEKKNASEDYLDGLYHAQLTLLKGFDIDFTKIQVAILKGLTYEEMKEYLKEN